jgi:hypothetical protein
MLGIRRWVAEERRKSGMSSSGGEGGIRTLDTR